MQDQSCLPPLPDTGRRDGGSPSPFPLFVNLRREFESNLRKDGFSEDALALPSGERAGASVIAKG